jgi:hypothetical protein
MRYWLFLLFFFFISFEEKNNNNNNFICKTANKIYFFKDVKKSYMYIDYYQYDISKIGIFDCNLHTHCKLNKIINNKKILSNSKFFNHCESKKI